MRKLKIKRRDNNQNQDAGESYFTYIGTVVSDDTADKSVIVARNPYEALSKFAEKNMGNESNATNLDVRIEQTEVIQ